MQSFSPGFSRIDTVRYEDVYSTLKTGDLIFTKARNFMSKLQQFAFGSFVNHCAMIYRQGDSLWVLDTNMGTGMYMAPFREFAEYNWMGRQHLLAKSPPIGLEIPYIKPVRSRFAIKTKSSLYIRRLSRPLDNRLVLKFLQENIGRPYSYRFWISAARNVFGMDLPVPYSLNTDATGMFCSELLAHAYIQTGALSPRTVPSSVLPGDFWYNSLEWTNDYYLHPPQRLIGRSIDVSFKPPSTEWQEGVTETYDESLAHRLVDLLP